MKINTEIEIGLEISNCGLNITIESMRPTQWNLTIPVTYGSGISGCNKKKRWLHYRD